MSGIDLSINAIACPKNILKPLVYLPLNESLAQAMHMIQDEERVSEFA